MSLADKLKAKLSKYESETLDEKVTFSTDDTWAHTGSPELDFNLGVLGFPKGIIEIAGPSRSGKTTIGLTAMKYFLKADENAIGIMLLAEERLQKEYAEKIGVPVEQVFIVKSRYIEDLFYKAQIHIDTIEEEWSELKLAGKPKIFIMWDSIGSTNSRAELETFKNNTKVYKENLEKGTKKELKHAKMGDFASAAKRCMKAMLAQLYEKDIVFVAINHLIANFDTGGSSSTGGKWVEYMPTIRLITQRKEWITFDVGGKPQEVGQITVVKIEKNDWGSRRKTEIRLLLGYGLVLSQADIDYAATKNLGLKKEGDSKYSYMNGKVKWNSPRTLFANYENPEKRKFIEILHKQIMSARHKDVLAEREI